MMPFTVLCVIAWRNLWRNPLRTLLTAGTIAGGVALLLVFFGLADGLHRMMLQNAVRLGGAHVAVQATGYQASRAIERTLPLEQATALAASSPAGGGGRVTVAPRIFASGLASSADGSSGVSIIGVVPAVEARVSLLDERLEAGAFLAEDSPNTAVIGAGVARKLRLAPGSKFVLMAQGPGSTEIQSLLIRVVGITRSGVDDIDLFGVLVPLGTAQELLGLSGRIHQAALFLADPNGTQRVAREVRTSSPPNAEVLAWDELMPSLRDYIRVDDAGLLIVGTIFFLIIAFLVMNTLLMSVLERRREFTLLDAVGLTPLRRFLLIMLESVWIALLAVSAGALGGYAGHAWFSRHGLELSLFSGSGYSAAGTTLDPVVYSVLSARRLATGVGLVFVLTVTLALLPARRAAAAQDAHLLGQT